MGRVEKLIQAICDVHGRPEFHITLEKGAEDWRRQGYSEDTIVADMEGILKRAKLLKKWKERRQISWGV